MCERISICATFETDDAMREASYEVARRKKIFLEAAEAHMAAYGTSQASIAHKRKMNALWDYMSARQEFNRRLQAYVETIEEYAMEVADKRQARED